MSSSTGMDAPGWDGLVFAEEVLEANRLTQYVFASTFALLFFEYMITFNREVHYAWGRRLTWARAMFFLNRYFSLLQYFATFASTILPPSYFRVQQACIVVLFGVWAVFSGLRVYAISGNQMGLTLLVVCLALVPVATSISLDALVRLEIMAIDPFPVLLCIQDSSNVNQLTSTMTHIDSECPVGVATRVPLLLSEAIVIIVTLIQTRNAYLEHPEQQCYASLVLQEGVLYFLAMLVVNIVQAVSDALLETTLAFVCVFLNLIPPIVVSRFYFRLDDLRTYEADREERRSLRWKPLPPTPATPAAMDDKVRYLHEVLAYAENANANA
ncbi:hypothetical protein L227DRAFT_606340 [Lentinus tigrinus ALCF2SS1-6]|uniref:DUF6533 domain-containing protein n=1 Tax=Lentinus tigrinus ALCF2SS1-6 TaxID=1328759 RepID=A0A5C2SQT1_9APHY|nr:hypothetical protein L227DRAFT_606340 [Lentinus tigrinus ALCF2SS1-6]